MQRQTLIALVLALGPAGTFAQADGSLAGVTMRVLDDVTDLDAVVLELDAGRAADAEGVEAGGGDGAAREDEQSGEAARDEPQTNASESDDLHDADDDERNEGRLEDRVVERPAAPEPPAPQ